MNSETYADIQFLVLVGVIGTEETGIAAGNEKRFPFQYHSITPMSTNAPSAP